MPLTPAPRPTLPVKPVLESSVLAELDLDIVRAQLVNCIASACFRLQHDNEGLTADATLYRVEDMSVLFLLNSNQGPDRLYRFHLVNPDGTSVTLTRFSEDGDVLELDEFDAAFVNSLSYTLRDTVCEAYRHMVRLPRPATHDAITTLQ